MQIKDTYLLQKTPYQKYRSRNYYGFTLVELIVVIKNNRLVP